MNGRTAHRHEYHGVSRRRTPALDPRRDPSRRGRARRGGRAPSRSGSCHTLRDTEIKFGLSVTGLVHPDEVLTNAAGREGDALVLTKPLGTGFVTTANKKGECPPEVVAAGRGDDPGSTSSAATPSGQPAGHCGYRRHRLRPRGPRLRDGRRLRAHGRDRGRRPAHHRGGAVAGRPQVFHEGEQVEPGLPGEAGSASNRRPTRLSSSSPSTPRPPEASSSPSTLPTPTASWPS